MRKVKRVSSGVEARRPACRHARGRSRRRCRGRGPGPAGPGRAAPRKNGWNRRAIAAAGIGSPWLATDSSKRRRRSRALAPRPAVRRAVRQRVGQQVREQLGDARAVAVDRRGRGRSRSRSSRSGQAARSSAIDLLQHRLAARSSALRSSARPPPRRPRAKSSTLSISPAMRATLLLDHASTIVVALLVERRLARAACAPPSIEASGLRRSWPSTAMNCSRSSAVWRSSQQRRLARRQPLLRVEVEGDQLGEQLEHADRLRRVQLAPAADRSRTACRRTRRPARMIGIEM